MWPWASLSVSVCETWQNTESASLTSWDAGSTWRGVGAKCSVSGSTFPAPLPASPPSPRFVLPFLLSSPPREDYYFYLIDKEDKVRKVKCFLWEVGFCCCFFNEDVEEGTINVGVAPFFLGQVGHLQTSERTSCRKWRHVEECCFSGQGQD